MIQTKGTGHGNSHVTFICKKYLSWAEEHKIGVTQNTLRASSLDVFEPPLSCKHLRRVTHSFIHDSLTVELQVVINAMSDYETQWTAAR